MAGQTEMKLAELGITLPQPMPPVANYVPYVQTGNLVVVSGQVPAVDGKVAITGKLGYGVSTERGRAFVSSTCWCTSRRRARATWTACAAWCGWAASSRARRSSPTRRR
jgi:hypothetical protein